MYACDPLGQPRMRAPSVRRGYAPHRSEPPGDLPRARRFADARTCRARAVSPGRRWTSWCGSWSGGRWSSSIRRRPVPATGCSTASGRSPASGRMRPGSRMCSPTPVVAGCGRSPPRWPRACAGRPGRARRPHRRRARDGRRRAAPDPAARPGHRSRDRRRPRVGMGPARRRRGRRPAARRPDAGRTSCAAGAGAAPGELDRGDVRRPGRGAARARRRGGAHRRRPASSPTSPLGTPGSCSPRRAGPRGPRGPRVVPGGVRGRRLCLGGGRQRLDGRFRPSRPGRHDRRAHRMRGGDPDPDPAGRHLGPAARRGRARPGRAGRGPLRRRRRATTPTPSALRTLSASGVPRPCTGRTSAAPSTQRVISTAVATLRQAADEAERAGDLRLLATTRVALAQALLSVGDRAAGRGSC